MKKLFLPAMLLIFIVTGAQSQQMPPIPVDAKVKIGKLENGLTYYIRENKLPENRAHFYIVQRVGSVLEEESQRGLAHFLEHMAFNGTENFPGGSESQNVISYLETIGVKFGTNLNAYTGMDETVYNINDVPTDKVGAVESCLTILHDWSSALLLREDDIDKERKVIYEEWRTRRDASQRMIDSIAPAIFKDSKYAERMPIGLMSVVQNFEPQQLRDYYHKWYRPDLQGIVIVGDIDADAIENKVKELFSTIPAHDNPEERIYEPIPSNIEPIIAVATDKELPANNIIISYKRNPIPQEQKQNLDYLIYDYATQIIGQMLNDRLQEMLPRSETPFVYAAASNASYWGVAAQDALQVVGVAKPNESEITISVLMQEVRRAHHFGFTENEYERAKANYMSGLERNYNERDKQLSRYYVGQYVNHFLKNDPIPSIEDRYNVMKQLTPNIPLQAINQILQQLVSDENRVVVLIGPEQEKESYPSVNQIAEIIKLVDAQELTAYEDNTVTEPLMSSMPTPGTVIKEHYDISKDATIWTLSNGATVVVKKTDHKQDEILMRGFAYGGTNVIEDEFINEIKLLGDLASVGGLGQLSATDLKKNLSGKNVQVAFSVLQNNEQITAHSNNKDLETMMQLVYLNFTDVRKDEEAFESATTRMKGILPTLAGNPDFVFSDSLLNTIYMNNPRFSIPKVVEIDAINYDKVLKVYNERFANAANFTFAFVGNIDMETLKPLVELYIGSLPGNPATASEQVKVMPTQKGIYNNHFALTMQTPKATTAIVYTGDMEYQLANIIRLNALGQLFQMEFIDKIREEKGGTYGVRVHQEAEKLPIESFTLQFQFDTDPSRRDELVEAMNLIVDNLQQNGPDEDMLQKVKEYMLKQHADNQKENSYALRNTWHYYIYNVDMEQDYTVLVNQLSVQSMKQFLNELIQQGNRIEVSMTHQDE